MKVATIIFHGLIGAAMAASVHEKRGAVFTDSNGNLDVAPGSGAVSAALIVVGGAINELQGILGVTNSGNVDEKGPEIQASVDNLTDAASNLTQAVTDVGNAKRDNLKRDDGPDFENVGNFMGVAGPVLSGAAHLANTILTGVTKGVLYNGNHGDYGLVNAGRQTINSVGGAMVFAGPIAA